MLYPSINEMMKGQSSRYSLVIATAKLARKISLDAEKNKEQLEENPVRTAVHILHKGIKTGGIKIVDPQIK